MYNTQILILSIIGILWLLCFIKIVLSTDDKKSTLEWIMFFSIVNSVVFAITIMLIVEMNELKEKVKGKCPELEKVENVYRIVDK